MLAGNARLSLKVALEYLQMISDEVQKQLGWPWQISRWSNGWILYKEDVMEHDVVEPLPWHATSEKIIIKHIGPAEHVL